MSLSEGARLGLYEILSPIGAGGMGEVYKARDTKLDRFVAVKVLPEEFSKDPDRLARFEREAKAVAALSHPNILSIYDFGKEGDTAYAVTELLEGETLRGKLGGKPLPARKATEVALQVARGLCAAHDQGIIHRDLKPENIFLTKDGRVKILDFGLAKVQLEKTGRESATRSYLSGAGTVVGTLGYMSPEQVRGDGSDARSDLFSLGVVLWEMLAGKGPFQRESGVETMHAILKEEPPDLDPALKVPPDLARILDYCLAKDPASRFHSAHDLAFALGGTSSQSGSGRQGALPARRSAGWRPVAWCLLGAALVLGWMGLAFLRRFPPFSPPVLPSFERLTFAPGTVESAFFGPDGRTIYFTQRQRGEKPEIFVIHPDSPEPQSLGLHDALLLGVSAESELAFLRRPVRQYTYMNRGLLSRAGAGGGSARELLQGVTEAAWEGKGLLTLSVDDREQLHLEFPVGKVILDVNAGVRVVKLLRVSGNRLALVEADRISGTEIAVYDRGGKRRVIYTKIGDALGESITGMAWGPLEELWFSELQGDQTALFALSMEGGRRLVWRGYGALQLMDVSPAGRVLLASQQVRRGVWVQEAGAALPKEVSILSGTQASNLSADGKTLLLLESPELDGGTAQDLTYLLRLDGSPPMKLTRGTPLSLSPDEQWVIVSVYGLDPKTLEGDILAAFQEAGLDPKVVLGANAPKSCMLLVPTGPGRTFLLMLPEGFNNNDAAYMHPDGRQVLFNASVNGQSCYFLMDRKGGRPRLIASGGMGGSWAGLVPLSPDGTQLIVSLNGKDWFLQRLAGGEPRRIEGIQLNGERAVGWDQDGRHIYIRSGLTDLPVVITRLDPASGKREPVLTFTPPDPSGHVQTRSVAMTPDAKVFAFTYDRRLSELYVVEGLK
jgi:eukaryotic-like serine/threonine-protein kinase